jgi:hypothetical protein
VQRQPKIGAVLKNCIVNLREADVMLPPDFEESAQMVGHCFANPLAAAS